jgi:hypothetical protein
MGASCALLTLDRGAAFGRAGLFASFGRDRHEWPLSILGQKCLTLGSELHDAAELFPQVLAADWVKGVRRSTSNVERQTKLT